jgi:pimeloyl-ACP methyl ester carboxylesterase
VSRVEANGLALELHEWGEADSPTLLFWHGAGDHGKQFEQAGKVLADEDGVHVLAPDAPGHGGSEPLPDDRYLPSELARVAAALLDARGIEKVFFSGFSWGASVACSFAAAYPERTRALVLIEGGIVDFHDDARYRDRPLEELIAEHGLDGALHWASWREPVTATYPMLRDLRTPVLLVTDSREHYRAALGFDPMERLRREVPQTEVREVESPRGHDLLAHDPRNLARTIGDWLSERDLI